MIGLGPHEMTAWLWAFSVVLTAVFTVLAALSICVAVRATDNRRPRARASRFNPYPIRVVRWDATRRRRIDDRDRTP